MPGDYNVLSKVYLELGMSDFAHAVAPRVLDFVQRHDWMGRQVLDLGSGTGAGMEWLAKHGYFTTGVDNAADMLDIGQRNFAKHGYDVRWEEQDIRALQHLSNFDLALAFDVLNELESLRDLEAAFRSIHATLKQGKLLIFDLYTLQGLMERNEQDAMHLYENATLNIFATNSFDYERQAHARRFVIFQQSSADAWTRYQGQRVLRAYPVQAVVALVQRCGFKAAHVLQTNLTPYVPGTTQAPRVIIVAEKQ